MSNLEVIRGDVYSVAQTWDTIKADRSLVFEAEAGFAMQTLMASDYAMSIAMQNRQSVINAVTNIAAIGISLNPAKKQAYLVPRDGRICLDISYMGLMDLAMQSGSIRWAQCALVHEADDFALNGLDKQPHHKFNPFSKDRGAIVGVYAVVKTLDGDYLTHAMAIDDVHAIRDRSSAWKAWVNKKKSCPWVTDEGEMIKKTCIKQACKYWPRGEKSSLLDNAIHHLNNDAGEGFAQEEEKPQAPANRPTGGMLEAMTKEEQQIMRELAAEIDSMFRDQSVSAAFDHVKAQNLDSDQTVALWSLLQSDVRSGLKKEGKERAEAAKAIQA